MMPEATTRSRYDVLVIGGALMGSSVAYFLKQLAPGCSVAVVEPDPVYEFASSLRASGSARRLFSCPENIAMSSYSIELLRGFARAQWRPGGGLFIVPPQGAAARA